MNFTGSTVERLMENNANEIPVHEVISRIMESGDLESLPALLADMHPADIADALRRLDIEHQPALILQLPPEPASDVLRELDDSTLETLLDNLSDQSIIKLLKELESDDAADVVAILDTERIPAILEALPAKDNFDLRTLLFHDEETAGGLMALEIVAVNQDCSAQEALKTLRLKKEEVDDVYNIYAVDRRGILRGLASLKDVVLADPKAKLRDIMNTDVPRIHPEMDQEEVAHLFQKYDLVAAPVVDSANRLVGRITVDDILDVVEEETNEDVTMMAGITDEAISERSVFRLSWVRLPWLLVAFFGELISAQIMKHFNVSSSKIIISAYFIPLIMAMGGNTGIQSATIVIRGLATGEFSLRDTGARLVREISVALMNGLVIATLLFTVVTLWLHEPNFGILLGIAMISVLFMASFMGTIIPFILKRINIDPAVATGPFITTTNDVLGLLVYFGMIHFFSNWL